MSNIIKIEPSNGKKFDLKFCDDLEDFANGSLSGQDQLSSLLQQNFEKGYKEGYEAAGKDLQKNFESQLDIEKSNLEKFMKHVDKMMLNYDNDYESLVIDLAFKISDKIVRREISRESNIIDVLREAVRKVIGANNVLIKLNPEDYEKINKENSGTKFMDESLAKVNFQTDDRIEKGGCVVETDIGNVDARIAAQMAELNKYFNRKN